MGERLLCKQEVAGSIPAGSTSVSACERPPGFIQIVAGSERSPETREQLVEHYRKQRDTVATMITESLSDGIDPEDARHIASLLMSVSDGLMLQSLIDPDDVPTSRQLTMALGRARKAAST
jgi:hypothetical protein